MEIVDTELRDVKLLKPKAFGDDRGFFMETWREDQFINQVADFRFVQDNHSKSVQSVLRGLHYQIRHAQGKLVRVISGKVLDVAVDIRRHSREFGRWTSVVLSGENRHILWVPPGFAHGFYVLSPEAEFLYKCTDYYAPDYEKTIRWDDPAIGIDWSLIPGEKPLLSDKDAKGVLLQHAEVYP